MFFEWDPIRQVIFLTSGSVKLSQTGPSGQEVILRVVGPGEFLGAECFMKYHHCSTARSMQPSTALVWEVSQFEALAARFPALARNISCILLRRLGQLEVRFQEVSTENVATR
jgi:CRP/FNR family transcriptional regulator